MTSRRRAPSREQQLIPRTSYASYESAKREWHAKNPGATQSQIDAAMRDIARKCGV